MATNTNAIDLGEKLLELEEKTEWPDPIPINSNVKLPDFPTEVLPSLGKEIVEAITEVNQVDAGLPGAIYLGILSTCLAKKVGIFLKTHREPVNLFVCSIVETGERKSSTMSLMTLPLYEFQEKKNTELKAEITSALCEFEISKARLNKLQRDAAISKSETERKYLKKEAQELAKEIEQTPIPKEITLVCDDITSEKVSMLMADNHERISIISSEGGIFGTMAGRYEEKSSGNFDVYLKGHAGDALSQHRVGREAKDMLSPALTMCLTVQPEVIKEIGKNRQFRGRGLLARFLYNRCSSQVGFRKRQTKTLSDGLVDLYRKHVHSFLSIPLEYQTLLLSSDAQSAWDSFYDDIEKDMRPENPLEHIKDWASKLPGAVARISGLLHFGEHGKDANNRTISTKTINAACAIGAYYYQHALATFGLMQADPKIEAAELILDYLLRHKPIIFKGRDILRHKNALRTMDAVNHGLKILMERGYIREQEGKPQGTGRPEAVIFKVNPKTYA